ncbi:MAG: thiamine-phosphate kinase [Planctomycetota bacterium]|nr:thiamine-phosphate kinase [Planctomycetota bacterium]
MPGEFEFLDWVRKQQRPSQFVPIPAGDDMAVVNWPPGELLLVGVDQVLDGVHFDSALHDPRDIGRKVMNRNLSDCAAMACLPAADVATVALKRGSPLSYSKELYLGLRDAADVYDCPIIGGDTAAWDDRLLVTVTILGRTAGLRPILRKGAQPGNGIYVTGPLGGSILGRHMTFTPRVNEGRKLAESGVVTAMIDISDALSRDLRHLCQQGGVGAIIHAATVPIHADAIQLSKQTHWDPLDHALHDGEDHELLFTTLRTPPLGIQIGTITQDPAVLLQVNGQTLPLAPKGWEHRL